MLSIKRDRIYTNRYFLSGLAVFAGFLVTVGIIRATNPVDNSTNQSAQSDSERRAKSIMPIKTTESESSSESDKKEDSANSSPVATPAPESAGSAAVSGYSIEPVSAEGWTRPPTTSTSASSQPAPSSTSSSTPTATSTTTAPAPSPEPTNPQTTCTIVAGIKVCLPAV